jgi:general secretion pathway protein J
MKGRRGSSSLPVARAGQERGFTLLELLLAITILGLLMSVLAGGLRFGARAWESGDARAEELTELAVVQGFLRRLIGQAQPLASREASGFVPAFTGGSEAMALVALSPAHLGEGGFHAFSIGFEEAGGGRRLVLVWEPLREGEAGLGAGGTPHRTVLLEGIETASFAYLDPGGPDRPPAWLTSWQDPLRAPARPP